MSVNEVRRKPMSVPPMTIKGTGPITARTFCIGNEDHTLGNALRHVLIQNHQVEFAGYSVPHPADPIVQIRIQTHHHNANNNSTPPPATRTSRTTTPTQQPIISAATALKQACQTIYDQCDHVLTKLEELRPEVKEDRIFWDQYMMEQQDDDEEVEEEINNNNNGEILDDDEEAHINDNDDGYLDGGNDGDVIMGEEDS